jgi:riboflavin synthase
MKLQFVLRLNGVSLTVVDSNENSFSVAIIPYTYNNTNFNQINVGTKVNLEFDIIGKYISKMINNKG